MRRILISFLFALMLMPGLQAQNQVGINAEPVDASAVLEVESTVRGVLIPRMSSNQRRNINSPADGLLVFETNSNSFWYTSNGSWVEIIFGGGVQDGIGDADSDTRIFLEFTSDDDLIRFYQLGIEYIRMRAHRFEFRNVGGSVFIGESAGENDDYVTNYNVFIGTRAGSNNVSGRRNHAIGHQAMENHISDNDNVAIGFHAARAYEDVRRSIAIGSRSLTLLDSSDNNIALGFNSMASHTDRTFNTCVGIASQRSSVNTRSNVAIGNSSFGNSVNSGFGVAVGHQAGQGGLNNNIICLGHRAGANSASSNRLFIDNTSTSSPLIWGNFSTDSVRINGDLFVSGSITYVGNITDISDRRLKTKIKKVKNVLPQLTKLQAYSYNMKTDSKSERQHGFIAQEVEEVFPRLSRVVDIENNYSGVSYVQFIPLILEAEKEQYEQLQTLGKGIDKHSAEVNELGLDIQQIKAHLTASTSK